MQTAYPERSWTLDRQIASSVEFNLRNLVWLTNFKGSSSSAQEAERARPKEKMIPDFLKEQIALAEEQEKLEKKVTDRPKMSQEYATNYLASIMGNNLAPVQPSTDEDRAKVDAIINSVKVTENI